MIVLATAATVYALKVVEVREVQRVTAVRGLEEVLQLDTVRRDGEVEEILLEHQEFAEQLNRRRLDLEEADLRVAPHKEVHMRERVQQLEHRRAADPRSLEHAVSHRRPRSERPVNIRWLGCRCRVHLDARAAQNADRMERVHAEANGTAEGVGPRKIAEDEQHV
ncbi:MAG: hypothetical protein ACOZQL_19085 [Myxococcota bacterium]